MPRCRYVGETGWSAMLAAKRSASVAPQMNLRERVTHTYPQVRIRLPTLVLKSRGDVTIGPNQGYQWPHKKAQRTYVVQKSKKKRFHKAIDFNEIT